MGVLDDPQLVETGDDNGPRFRTIAEVVGAITGSFSPSGLTVGGQVTKIALVSTEWRKFERSGTTTPVGSGPLDKRNNITVQNVSDNGSTILWNYGAAEPSDIGFRILDGGFKSVALTDSIDVYGRMESGSGEAMIDEVA